MANISFNDGRSVLTAPETRLWISPLSPTTLRADLPPALEIAPVSAVSPDSSLSGMSLALSDGTLSAKVSPLHDLQLTRLDLGTGAVALNGRDLAQALSGRAELAALAHDRPKRPVRPMISIWLWPRLIPKACPRFRSCACPRG
ncbi:hypothetical protein [Paracoccus cavernae]|uniref:hypothetical protein n=1 Tax=Paracoccus cavernae TaxID=1571207 RepID=UPI0036271B9E